ncbi:MAG: hypothetical protein N4A61_07720 [Pelagimonas sp.]|nr:hypothetical protein [Pelagimonas sp.]
MTYIATPWGVALFLGFWLIKTAGGLWLTQSAERGLTPKAQTRAYSNLRLLGGKRPHAEPME